MALIERNSVIAEAKSAATFYKAGAFSSNDFAATCAVGSLGVDTTNGKEYICTASNGSTTSTWAVVGSQS